jgi:probable HAF family extracellular repeat protein
VIRKSDQPAQLGSANQFRRNSMTSPKHYALMLSLIVVFAFVTGLVAQRAPHQPTGYLVFALPDSLGGTASAANAINDLGWPMGFADFSGNTTGQAVAWIEGRMVKLGTLGGPNSSVEWEGVKNNKGLIVGVSDTSIVQPRGETWSCALAGFLPSFSGNTCLGFLWQDGFMRQLPTLGGDNGVATGINNRDQVVGWAETSHKDKSCNAPQVLQFEAYVYDVKSAKINALPLFPGAPDSAATGINDKGQIIGIAGLCSNAVGGASAIHAVLWQDENSTPIDLGNIGGMAWNTPASINLEGQIVGFANPSGDQNAGFNPIGFLWTETGGMQNLGTLAGYQNSIAYAINNHGLIVGQSFNGPNGASHAFIYQNGMMTDLNGLIVGHTPLTLVYANDVNDDGVIVGGAFNAKTGASPAFVAIPY